MTLDEYKEVIKDAVESFLINHRHVFQEQGLTRTTDIAKFLVENEDLKKAVMSYHKSNEFHDVIYSIPLLNQICLQKGISHKKIGNLVLEGNYKALDAIIKEDYYWDITVDLLMNNKFVRKTLSLED